MKLLNKIIFIFLLCFGNAVFAASGSMSIIRDTEIENFLRNIMKPIFISAGLNAKDISFYIVGDNNVNAFVMGGQNIFVYSGIFTSFDTPDAVIGILAHETGHIAGGHLARVGDSMSGVQNVSIGSILLGIGAMIAGAPELGQAIIFGGMQIGQQTYLKYSRGQEESADLLATEYLNKNNISSEALLVSMNKFYMNELDFSGNMEYFATHPLSRNRKEFVENKIRKENNLNVDWFNKIYGTEFNFIKAKIIAFNGGDLSFARGTDYEVYAKAIIFMRHGKTKEALASIDYLIDKYKNNPYFFELKGDIYLGANDVDNALIWYNKADELLKDNVLIKNTIAFIIIKYKKENLYNDAENKLNFVIKYDERNPGALKLMGELYFSKGDLAQSYLYLADYYSKIRDKKKALRYLDMAKKEPKDKKTERKIGDLEIFVNDIKTK